jgi:hypothetical protein
MADFILPEPGELDTWGTKISGSLTYLKDEADALETRADATDSTLGTVDTRLDALEATPPGGGGSQVYVWRYADGAYPALPGSAPAGVLLVMAKGPVAPTTVPGWVGGPDGVLLDYNYDPSLS